jgi:hypothetical protein
MRTCIRCPDSAAEATPPAGRKNDTKREEGRMSENTSKSALLYKYYIYGE